MLAEHSHPGFQNGKGGKGPPRILLVGGNHDVNWQEVFGPAGAVWERLLNLLEEMRQAAVNHASIEEVVKRLKHLSRIDPGLVHDEDLIKAGKHSWEQPVRIAVLHHPVSPLPATEVAHFAGLVNAGRVKNLLLEQRFCLVLHGHMHFGWFAAERWPGKHDGWVLHIAAAPTLGSRETQDKLGYNVVEVAREGDDRFEVTVTRVAHDTGGAWEEKETMGPILLPPDGSTVKQGHGNPVRSGAHRLGAGEGR
jgi:hypothetical protein